MPDMPAELLARIKLVRRDFGSLLFHFTRASEQGRVRIDSGNGGSMSLDGSADSVLRKILYEGRLVGSSRWTNGQKCVCFTEAPIQEFNSIFSLNEIAASERERPRYEPYGIAVSKTWLFKKGGRPVIYDHPDDFSSYPESQKYRLVPYDLTEGVDYTWEREWRIRSDLLELEPSETLVVVPTSEDAFDLVYEFAGTDADYDETGPVSIYHVAKWLAVSLDIFGFTQV